MELYWRLLLLMFLLSEFLLAFQGRPMLADGQLSPRLRLFLRNTPGGIYDVALEIR